MKIRKKNIIKKKNINNTTMMKDTVEKNKTMTIKKKQE